MTIQINCQFSIDFNYHRAVQINITSELDIATGNNGILQSFLGRHFSSIRRHRHDGQHYSHHKQGQRYAYYFFHVNLSFLFLVFCPQGGSCLHTNTKTPHGASDTPILARFCPQCQYPCVIFCINFPLIFVHHAIFGTHPAKKRPRKLMPSGDFPNFSVIPLP